MPLSLDGEKSLSDVRNMIHKLYTSLNVEKHQVLLWLLKKKSSFVYDSVCVSGYFFIKGIVSRYKSYF